MNTLATTIQTYRKQRGYTQDDLAALIGVTAGAISKWECGHTLPDISLLAPLARAFHITLDELLSFQKDLSKEEVHDIKQTMILQFSKNGYEKTEKQILDLLHEYPNQMYLTLSMTSVLYMHLMYVSKPQERNMKLHLIKDMLVRVMSCANSSLVMQASYVYAMLLMDMDEFEEAEQVIEDMACSSMDIQALYLNLYQRQNRQDQLKKAAQQILLENVTKMSSALSVLANVSKDEEALMFLQNCDDLHVTYQFSYRQSQRLIAMHQVRQHRLPEAAKAYLCYIESLLSFSHSRPANPYFTDLTWEYKEEPLRHMNKQLLEMEMEDRTWEVLSPHPEYKKARMLIQDYLKENTCSS